MWRPRQLVLVFAVFWFGAAQTAFAASSQWVLITSPGSYGYELLAASGGASDGWATGTEFVSGTGRNLALTEHWTGRGWSLVAAPSPGTDVQLNGVADIGAADAWAVGFYNSSWWGNNKTLAEHWNGSTWRQYPTPNPVSAENDLWGVYAAASNDVWAVGRSYPATGEQTLIEHWNGSRWAVVPSPNPSSDDALHAVSGSSPNDIWAAGTQYVAATAQTKVLVEHWDGRSWSVVSAPAVQHDDYIRSIAVGPAGDAWIVGEADAAAPQYTPFPLIEHWNGTAWSVVASQNLGAISGVTSLSATDAWIAGVHSYPGSLGGTLIEHWNGKTWLPVASPNRVTPGGSSFDSLNAIARTGSGSLLMAVGSYEAPNTGGTLVIQTSQG